MGAWRDIATYNSRQGLTSFFEGGEAGGEEKAQSAHDVVHKAPRAALKRLYFPGRYVFSCRITGE